MCFAYTDNLYTFTHTSIFSKTAEKYTWILECRPWNELNWIKHACSRAWWKLLCGVMSKTFEQLKRKIRERTSPVLVPYWTLNVKLSLFTIEPCAFNGFHIEVYWIALLLRHTCYCSEEIKTLTSVMHIKKLNSVAWVRERTTPTEQPPLVGEISTNFCGQSVPRGQRDGSLRPYSRFSRPEPLHFLSSSSSFVLTRLRGPRSRSTASVKIW
jgi:hypothetical protein